MSSRSHYSSLSSSSSFEKVADLDAEEVNTSFESTEEHEEPQVVEKEQVEQDEWNAEGGDYNWEVEERVVPEVGLDVSDDSDEEESESSDEEEEEEMEDHFEEEEPKKEIEDSWLGTAVVLKETGAEIVEPLPTSWDTYKVPTREEKLIEELDCAWNSNNELDREVRLMKMQVKDLRRSLRTSESNVQSTLEGKWKLHSSLNMHEFLEARRVVEFAKGKKFEEVTLDEVLFQTAFHNIEFTNLAVNLYDTVGTRKFNENSMYWNEPDHVSSTETQMTWIAGYVMKTVKMGGEEEDIEERFVVGDQLHVVFQKNGKRCERIYKREGAVDEDVMRLRVLVTKMHLGHQNLMEQMEDREVARDLEKSQLMVKIGELQEQLESEKKTSLESQLKIKELEEQVDQKEEKDQKEEEKEKEEEEKKETFPEIPLTGLWRQITNQGRILSMKLEGGKFYRKSVKTEDTSYNVYELNKKSSDLVVTSIENGKLIQKQYNQQEELTIVRERFVENGMLVSIQTKISEEKTDRWEFERIGEPLD